MKRALTFLATLAILGLVLYVVSVTGGLPEPWGTRVGQTLSHAGHFIYLFLCGTFLLFGPLRPGESRILRGLWTLGAVIFNFAVVEALKHLVFWPRPIDVGETATTASRGSGFPSGHTVPDFLFAVLVGTLEPRLQIPALLMAGLVGYSRAEVTAHFPIQVWLSALIGIVIGVLWTQLWFRLTTARQNPETNQPPLARP